MLLEMYLLHEKREHSKFKLKLDSNTEQTRTDSLSDARVLNPHY